MKIKRNFFIIIMALVSMSILFSSFTKADKKFDLITNLTTLVGSSVVEYGVTVEFSTNKQPEKVCDDILKNFNIYGEWDKDIFKSEKTYCVEFKKNNINGYIETIQYENHNIVKLNIIKKDNKNNLQSLKEELKKHIVGNNIKYYDYLKVKTSDSDLEYVNKKIVKILKNYKVNNINILNIENGYSATAYTGFSDNKIYSNGRYIDLNYAVCKYSSGVYLIIGTPEITVTY